MYETYQEMPLPGIKPETMNVEGEHPIDWVTGTGFTLSSKVWYG